jgi:catechol 2,3-dioxygenase-like lactoylglutathione lyase family enzyme
MNPIQLKGLDHVVLRVSDLDRALHFYRDVLGCPVERRLDELGLVQLRAGASLVDLVDIASPLGRAGGGAASSDAHNMDHFALTLSSFDEGAVREWLTRFGVEAGEAGRRYGAEGYGPSIYIRDPDGNTVELKAPPDAEGALAQGDHPAG